MVARANIEQETQTALDLFSPIQLGPYELRNRIVMAPLTRSRAGEGNVPHGLNALYYAQRASAGLVIGEATQISQQGQGYISTPGIHSADQVRGWRCVTEAVHTLGGHMFLQLWHVGRISHESFQPNGAQPVAPSAIRPNGNAFTTNGFEPHPTPRALGIDELPGLVEDYRNAACNALAAGFDGVEVHSANGYLLDQFLRDGTNQRSDEYGGRIENRSRLLLEVVDAVIEIVGADRMGVRISPQNSQNDISDSDPQTLFNHVAARLSDKGLAYLHVIEGDTMGQPVGPFDYQAVRQRFDGLYMANNGFDKARANRAIAENSADLIAFGKPFIANPDLVTRFLLDAPLGELNRDTLYGGAKEGYTDYPLLNAVAATPLPCWG